MVIVCLVFLFGECRTFEETCPFVSLTVFAAEFLVALNMCVTDKIQVVEKQELETPQKQVIITDEFIQGLILLAQLVGFLTMQRSED